MMLRGAVAVSMLCKMHPLFKRACKSMDLIYDEDKQHAGVLDLLNKPNVSIHNYCEVDPIHSSMEDKD